MLKKNRNLFSSAAFVLLFVCCGCVSQPAGDDSIFDETNQTQILVESFTITKAGSFQPDECQLRGLENKVIMFESKYCGHCATTLPVFQEACRELGIEPIILDITEESDNEQMKSYGLDIRFTPTFVFGCNYYLGVDTKENYINKCNIFLES